jgi:flagellar M-ring protein FliF
MAQLLALLRRRFIEPFKYLAPAQQLTMLMIFTLTIVGTIVVIKWATKPDFAVLAGDLDPADAQSMLEELRASKVPYQIDQGGKGILIPRSQVYEWRMKLAAKSLPSGSGLGYEIFDKKDIGISEFVQQINYRRALEGELSRTIQTMPEVSKVRVHIVLPKERLFKEDQKETTASVFLSLRGRGRLNEQQVNGIALLVSGSVEGLSMENVTIVDDHGNVLSKNRRPDSLTGLSEGQLETQLHVESYLEEKVESMLVPVVGTGNAIIRVRADLDFRRIDRTNEIIEPDNVVVLSEEIESQSTQNASGSSPSSSEHTVTNYQVPKSVEHIIGDVGNIKRLSVAVLVNERQIEEKGADGKSTFRSQARTPDELARLASLVRNAVGLDATRGDQIDIQNMPFEKPEWENNTTDHVDFLYRWMPIIQKVLLAALVVVGFVIVRSRLKKAMDAWQKANPQMPAMQMMPNLAGSPQIQQPSSTEITAQQLLEAQSKKAPQQEGVAQYVEQNPTTAALMVRSWMMEK